jgi:D-glycero-alpha-D-manno-heptose 1-phosphate guanylyltransferase
LTKEAIILAGGFGTRLQSVVSDVPKALAPVAGQPFLFFLLKQLKQNGFERLIFSLGYKHEMVEEYLWEWKDDFDMAFAIEEEPLGTGGGIRNAVMSAKEKSSFILNADTFFDIDFNAMNQLHQQQNADLTIALKPLTNFNRYGIVLMDEECNITGFKEKQATESGLINGGIYLLNNHLLTDFAFPEKFSFEKDFLETQLNFHHFKGYSSNNYFIDIGVPEDFAKANIDFVQA